MLVFLRRGAIGQMSVYGGQRTMVRFVFILGRICFTNAKDCFWVLCIFQLATMYFMPYYLGTGFIRVSRSGRVTSSDERSDTSRTGIKWEFVSKPKALFVNAIGGVPLVRFSWTKYHSQVETFLNTRICLIQ